MLLLIPSLFLLRLDMQLVKVLNIKEGKGTNIFKSLTKLVNFYNLST